MPLSKPPRPLSTGPLAMPGGVSHRALFWRWQPGLGPCLTHAAAMPEPPAGARGSAEPSAGSAPRADSRWAKLPAGREAAGCPGPPAALPAPASTGGRFSPSPLPQPPGAAPTPARDVPGRGLLPREGSSAGRVPRAGCGGSAAGHRPRPSLPGGWLRRPCAALPAGRGREAAAHRPAPLAASATRRLHPAAPAGREAPPPASHTPAPRLAARQHRPLPAAETHLQAGQGQGEDEREDHAEIHPDFRPRRLQAHGRREPGGKRFPQRAPRPPGLRHRGCPAFPFPLRAGLQVGELQEPLGEEVVVAVRGGQK